MESFVFPAVLDSLPEMRKRAMATAASAGLDKASGYRLALAVDEIATNIINYGYAKSDSEAEIRCLVEIDDETVRITLEDQGVPFDPREKTQPESLSLQLPVEERPIGGLGVFLALEGVDDFEYRRDGNTNRNVFIMNRSSASTDA